MSYHEKFNSIEMFSDALRSRKTPDGRGDASHSGSKGFTSTENYEEADMLMTRGWLEGVEKAKKMDIFNTLKFATDGNIPKPRPENHVVGYVPHVPNAIMNVPNSMIRTEREPRKVKVLDIVYAVCVDASISADKMLRASIPVIKFIMDTEAKGVRVNLTAIIGSEYQSNTYTVEVKLKDYKSPLNIQKLAYFMGHPSFLRRHTFKFWETMPCSVPNNFYGGYGRTISKSDLEKLAKDSMLIDIRDIINDSDYLKKMEVKVR